MSSSTVKPPVLPAHSADKSLFSRGREVGAVSCSSDGEDDEAEENELLRELEADLVSKSALARARPS